MKTNKIMRYLSAAILIALLFLLSSCSYVTINFDEIFPVTGTFADTETDHATEAERETSESTAPETLDIYEYMGLSLAEEYLASIGEYDFGGQTVFIKTTAEDADVLYPSIEENTDNTYSEAVYERNKMVEERYGCEFHYLTTTIEAMTADIKAAIKNEEYYSDLLAVRENELPILIKEGYLYNLRSLPFFDTGAEFFNVSASAALSAGYHDYGVISYATIDPDKISSVFINVGILGEEASDKAVAAVKAGEWSWDMFIELSAQSGAVTDFDLDTAADIVSASAGVTFIDNAKKDTPTVLLPERAFTATELCRRLFSEVLRFNVTENENGEALENVSLASERFAAGEEAFYIGVMGYMNELSSVPFEWSILPMPKTDVADEGYRAYVAESVLTLSVPINTADPDGASVLLRALASASSGYLRDAYVEYHMYHTVSSSAALSMIEAVYDSPFFYFERSLGTGSEKILDGTYSIIREAAKDPDADIEKLFNKYDNKVNDALEDLYEPIN